MPNLRDRLATLLLAAVLTACASAPKAPPAEYPALPKSAAPATPASAPASAPATAPAATPAVRDLKGEWVEFWALSGGADTQRYVFTPDGHYEWYAAAQATDKVAARFGTYAVQGDALELRVRFEQSKDPKPGCTGGCRSPVEPERVEQPALTDCPPNEEAKALDASYTCVAIGDRAFWRK